MWGAGTADTAPAPRPHCSSPAPQGTPLLFEGSFPPSQGAAPAMKYLRGSDDNRGLPRRPLDSPPPSQGCLRGAGPRRVVPMVTASWQPRPLPQPGLRPPRSGAAAATPRTDGRTDAPAAQGQPRRFANGRWSGGSALKSGARAAAGMQGSDGQPCPALSQHWWVRAAPRARRTACPNNVPPCCMAIEWCLRCHVLSAFVYPMFLQPPPRVPVTPPGSRARLPGRAAGAPEQLARRSAGASTRHSPGTDSSWALKCCRAALAQSSTWADQTCFCRGPSAWARQAGTVTAPCAEPPPALHGTPRNCSQTPQSTEGLCTALFHTTH